MICQNFSNVLLWRKQNLSGDAVGRESLQIWAGWMEPQPAEVSTCGQLSLFPPSLGSVWGSRGMWFGQQVQSLLLSCPACGGFHQSQGCSGKVQPLQLLPELPSGLPKEAELSMPHLRALAVQLMTALLSINHLTWFPKEQPPPKLQEVLLSLSGCVPGLLVHRAALSQQLWSQVCCGIHYCHAQQLCSSPLLQLCFLGTAIPSRPVVLLGIHHEHLG